MNVRELAEKHGYNADDFESFALKQTELKVKTAYGGARIDDSQVELLIEKYNEANPSAKAEFEAKKKAEEEAAAAEAAAESAERARMKKATAQMLVTSGFNFDGYKIVKYSGYISGYISGKVSTVTSCKDEISSAPSINKEPSAKG